MAEDELLPYDGGNVEAMSYSKLLYLSYLQGSTAENKIGGENLPSSSPVSSGAAVASSSSGSWATLR